MKICVIRQYYVPVDVRVRREIDVLAEAGHDVDVICLRRSGERLSERRGSVRIIRVPLRHRRGGLLTSALEHLAFLAATAVLSGGLHLTRRYDIVQVNTVPDTLVFAAVVPKLLGARVLLDLHECVPEFFASRFKTGMAHPAVGLLALAEQASIRFADHALTCTKQMRATFVRRGAPADKIDVVLNSADETVFAPERFPPKESLPGRLLLVSHGAVEERYGIDTTIRAVALLADQIPELRLVVYGEGSYRGPLERLAAAANVSDRVDFRGFVSDDDLLQGIAEADAGVVAMKRDIFRDLTHCNKMFELIAAGRPALMSRTAAVEDYFDESCFLFFESDDERDLGRAILALHEDRDLGARAVERARQVNEPYRWHHQAVRYRQVVEATPPGAGTPPPRDRKSVV